MSEKRRSSCGGCFGIIVVIIVAGAVVSIISKNGAPPSQPVASTPIPASAPLTPPSTNEHAVPAIPAPVAQQPATANATNQITPAPTPPPLVEDWTTTDGKTYKNVTIISHDATNVTINSSDETATFPISHLSQDLQKRVNDDLVTASDWTVNGKTFHNVKVGTVDSDVVHITYDGGAGTVALSDLPPDLRKKFNYDPNRASTPKEANALVGLTEQQVISKLGQPIRVEKDNSPDGPFEQLVFNDSKNAATFCMIFEQDGTTDGVLYRGGTVSSGSYHGLAFPAKTPDEMKAGKEKADAERPKTERDAFLATLKAAGIDNTVVDSVSVNGDVLTIVVTNVFHTLPYQTRLQGAQNFQKLWGSIHGGSAIIRITDFNGNEVGGTSVWSGAWVQKEQ